MVATPKIDWFDMVRRGGIIAVALGLLGLVIWMKFDVNARADPYTGSEAKVREALVDAGMVSQKERSDRIEAQLCELTEIMDAHARSAMHLGAFERFAELGAELRYISDSLMRIEKKLGSD